MAHDRRTEAASDQGHGQDGPEKLPIVYQIRATENMKAIPVVVKCCLCREPLEVSRNGYCDNCGTYPINVTPVRLCERGHSVKPSGWCYSCARYVLSELEPACGEWIDTGRIPKRLERSGINALVADMTRKLSGAGWPQKVVPLNERYIPRSWKRRKLRVVGETERGDKIVIPENAVVEKSEVPF
jgi:hypothetical protein